MQSDHANGASYTLGPLNLATGRLSEDSKSDKGLRGHSDGDEVTAVLSETALSADHQAEILRRAGGLRGLRRGRRVRPIDPSQVGTAIGGLEHLGVGTARAERRERRCAARPGPP